MTMSLRETVAVTDEAAAPWIRQAKNTEPDPRFARPDRLFFGIGAEKSGTSWLHNYLSGHPDVHFPRYEKELHYWSSALRGPKLPELLSRQMPRGPLRSFLGSVARPGKNLWRIRKNRFLRRWYKAFTEESPTQSVYCDVLFWGYRNQKVAGEITPAYARCNEETLAEMAALAPDVRFIFIMRDPVSRLWSGCRHQLRRKLGRDDTTTDAVAKRVLSCLGEASEIDRYGKVAFEASSYDLTIRHLENVVSPDKIAYFFYETMFQQSEIDRLCAFLGIESVPAAVDKKVHVGADASGGMPLDVAIKARQALAQTYDFCEAKFGTLPPEWQEDPTGRDA